MRTSYICLKREGYDPFIDYLKGICIFFVILNHCLPSEFTNKTFFCIWGSTAVPIFLIIQVFHTYKKGIERINTNYKKIWNRIIKPFLLTESIIICLHFTRHVIYGDTSTSQFIETTILWGGIGPGCYYPWIYIQFAILLPLFAAIFRKIKGTKLLLLFIVLSTIIEIVVANIIPTRIYRLLFLRYLFLIYLGNIIAVQGIRINITTSIIALIGMGATILFHYNDIYIYPFTNQKISICNWICYLYITFGFLKILKKLYSYPTKNLFINKGLQWMGIHSYEIFLIQMLVFSIIDLWKS
ncbi:acyltransferase family protein [Prevotella sp. E15-22]|uniref:acyltransferase family protein n=1 Tax=Prevotella sp. E15-22 TaxID=2937774 RepID=UPI0035317389